MKATEQYFTVALFVLLYKVVLTFEYVKMTLTCADINCTCLF